MCLRSVVMVVMICGYVSADFNVSHLIRDVLLKNYDREVRPVRNPSHPVNVSLSFGIRNIIKLDMRTQKFVLFGWLSVHWHDDFLTWDVESYPVTDVRMDARMVWRPELVVFNTVAELDTMIKQETRVVVQNDGKVTWYPGGLFKTFCSVDISRYPLDTQTCAVEILSWTADNDLVNGTFLSPAFELSSLTEPHPEWRLVDTQAVYTLRPSNYWLLSFKFVLRRRVMFYMVNIVLPIVLLSVMSCVVFLLPVDSGEKMTVSVTVFLSFTVFMTLINDSLPKNSDSFSLFSAYVASQMAFSVFSTFMAAVTVFILGKDCAATSSSQHSSQLTRRKSSYASVDSCFTPKSRASTISTMDAMYYSNSSTPPSLEMDVKDGQKTPQEATNRHSLCKTDVQSGHRSSFGSKAWCLLKNNGQLTSGEKRLLSQALDKLCLLVTVGINICAFLLFALLMLFT
ncbi:hypothetical protein ACOMHN_011773 [Nucella lapillus]